MAGRTVKALLDTACLYDGRFFQKTIRDWSPNGNNGVWGAKFPSFKRTNGQVVGLDFPDTSGEVVTVAGIAATGAFSVELLLRFRGLGGGGSGHPFSHGAAGARKRLYVYNAGGGTVGLDFTCGADITSGIGVTFQQHPIMHVVVARDVGNVGYIHINGAAAVVSGAVGANADTETLYIGERDDLARCFDGLIYSLRFFNTKLDVDEVNRLYESSRVRLWPGAQKRSGITSRIV